MPSGYGISADAEGSCPGSWVEEQLVASAQLLGLHDPR